MHALSRRVLYDGITQLTPRLSGSSTRPVLCSQETPQFIGLLTSVSGADKLTSNCAPQWSGRPPTPYPAAHAPAPECSGLLEQACQWPPLWAVQPDFPVDTRAGGRFPASVGQPNRPQDTPVTNFEHPPKDELNSKCPIIPFTKEQSLYASPRALNIPVIKN